MSQAAPNPDTSRIDEAREAFEMLFEAIEARRAEEVAPPSPRVDIGRAVALVLGASTQVRPLRAEIVRRCPDTDITNLDRLPTVALAAWYASLLAESEPEAAPTVAPLIAEARPLREKLLRAAELLAHYEIFDPDVVAEIRSGFGNLDTAEDLVKLARLFEEGGEAARDQSPVTEAMVERAAQLGASLVQAIGEAKSTQTAAPEVVGRRNAAFALLLETYGQVRRAVTYLRWSEGDADALAPSIYTARRVSRSGSGRASARRAQGGAAPDDASPAAGASGAANDGAVDGGAASA